MQTYLKMLLLCLVAVHLQSRASMAASERIALVVGNASYRGQQRVEIAANDAALIAGKLRSLGFEVTHTRDLNSGNLKSTFFDFVEKVSKAGPDAVALVYFSGYALQFQGENFLLPVDADVDIDVAETSILPRFALRVSDLTHSLSALRPQAALVILDAARGSPFLLSGQPPASGLAWIETAPNVLVASNAAPGMISPAFQSSDGYSLYAKAIAQMIEDRNSTLADGLVRVRIRVNEMTHGEQVPWHGSGILSQPSLFEHVTSKGPESREMDRLRLRPMPGLSGQDAYFAALMRDTLDSYADFLADHWRNPLAKRVRALLATRREVLLWQRVCRGGALENFWSYLERYPDGPHADEARRTLQKRNASPVPPPGFRQPEYDIPSPLPGEADYLVSPTAGFDPPPPVPAGLLGVTAETALLPITRTSEAEDGTVRSNSPMEQGTVSLEKNASLSPLSDIKRAQSSNSEGSISEGHSDTQVGIRLPYWVYPDMAPVRRKEDLTKALVSRFPEWVTSGLWPTTALELRSSDPVFTGALVPPASLDGDMPADQTAVTSMTTLRPSLTKPQATPRVRIPLPVARPTAGAALHAMPRQPLSSRRSQPTSSAGPRERLAPSR
jgi:Caspase domain